jgi:N-carbamoylputrescine amidase
MKVGVVQQAYTGDRAKMLIESVNRIEEATLEGAELIVLQELHQSQYFCITEDPAYFAYARDFDKDVAFWSAVAKKANVVLVTSLFEMRAPGIYHNTAVVFEKDGSIAGQYRKMHIPEDPGFYEKFYFTPGDRGFEPIDTSVGRLGVLICWDQWYPEAARIMALKGAEILIYPTAIGWFDEDDEAEKARQLDAWVTIQRAHAIANGLPLVSVNRVGKEFDPSGALDGIRFWGNSFVCGPQGEFLLRLDAEEDTAKVVDIDMRRVEEVRNIWPFFRDRRIDSYEGLNKRYIFKP